MSMKYVLLIVFMLNIVSAPVLSLDNHYWSHQFGSRSALMSGAVVGGVRDTSAGFYNPGALGFVKQSSFSVSGNSYQFEQMTLDDGVGTGDDIDSQEVGIIPLLVSGTFILGGNTFGYSIMTQQASSFNMSARHAGFFDIVASNPTLGTGTAFEGLEEYRGQYIYNSKLSEYWGGLSWAKRHHNISYGVSGFFALRTQNQDMMALARATNLHNSQGLQMGTQDFVRHVDFYNLRSFLKFGIAADFETLKLGATLTTPSVSLFGKGSSAQSLSTTKSDETFWYLNPNPTIPYNTVIDDRQEDLDAEYKTPLSIALGIEYAVTPKTRFAGSVEWFAKQDRYAVMTPASREMFVGKPPQFADIIIMDSEQALKVENAADEVVNFAIAVEHGFNDTYKGYFSFRTDFSTFNLNSTETEAIANDWDIYHTTLGMTHKGKASELALGLTYSFGKQDLLERPINLNPQSTNRSSANFLFPNSGNTSARYNAFGVIVGYTYFFK